MKPVALDPRGWVSSENLLIAFYPYCAIKGFKLIVSDLEPFTRSMAPAHGPWVLQSQSCMPSHRGRRSSMLCMRCDIDSPSDSSFCISCGSAVEAPRAVNGAYAAVGEHRPVVTSANFVGRQREVNALAAALDSAVAGHGQTVMLAGDPGIGKTRAAQEIASIAGSRGAEVVWGQCYEGEGAPPYWPWLRIIRSTIDSSDYERLEAEMGAGAETIGEIVLELRNKLPTLAYPPAFDPASARFQLLDAITTYSKNVSSRWPMILIVEDLHWADASLLALLEHVAGSIAASELMAVGTYRDTKVSVEHPLTRTLGSFVRQEGFQSLQLGGLSLGEVGELVALSMPGHQSPVIVEEVHRRTEGNPLFVGELLKLMETNGPVETPTWRFSIPHGIRAVIETRLGELSDACNKAMTVASVIGREFDFDLLSRMTGASDDDLLEIIDEAVDARVVEDLPGSFERYRFSHALIEQTLYERQTTSRRARLHARIGEAAEDLCGERFESHASELVGHFSRSSRRSDAEKALRYGTVAADRAATVYAYGESAAYLEQCLDIHRNLDPHDVETTCDLFIDLGEALVVAGEPKRAYEEIAPEAFAMAEAAGDNRRAFHSRRIAISG